jgi:hypothetical protein
MDDYNEKQDKNEMSVLEFRKKINLNSVLKIKEREFKIRQIIKFCLDDGDFYIKVFLENGYVLADDLENNYFIFVKEIERNNLIPNENEIIYKNKKFEFLYKASAVAEEIWGNGEFEKGEGEKFWDYKTKEDEYLSLGIVNKTSERMDLAGEIVYGKDIEIVN